MASSEEFLLQLAAEEHIPEARIRPIIDRLNQEWYDTKESLQKLTPEEMERLSVPLRLARLITEKLGGQGTDSPQPMTVEKEVKPVRTPTVDKGDCLAALVSAGVDDPVDSGLSDCITTLQLLVLNVLRYPGEEKYARIRLSNPKVAQKIGRFPDAIAFLKATGFTVDADQSLVMRTRDEGGLKEALGELNTVAENLGFPAMEVAPPPLAVPGFNPYKAQISSINPDNPRIAVTDNDPAAIARRTAQLQKAREEEAKRAQVTRDPVVLLISATGNLQAALRRLEEMENQRLTAKFGMGYTVGGGAVGTVATEDEELGAMKALIRENEENSKFHSKRKVELTRLERQRSYTAVTIRVRFPDRYLLQGTFSSVESPMAIYSFVASYLVTPARPFCLYIAPPKQVIEPSERRTLKEFAPATLVNFGWRDLGETGPMDGPFLGEEMKAGARSIDN